MFSVVLIEAHDPLRSLLKLLLEKEPDISVVADSGKGSLGIQEIALLHPDVVIMGLRLPDLNGLDAVAFIHERFPNSRIIVYTIYNEEAYAQEAIARGAASYIAKASPIQVVLEAVRSTGLVSICVQPR